MARAASRTIGSSRIVLVAYSVPSAHHISGQPFFRYPPIPESLEAARIEGRACASDGIRIDTLSIIQDPASEEGKALQGYLRHLTEEAGGTILTVTPSDRVEDSVGHLLRVQR
jgi:uncharacterized protein with von Willebrand factor type A (vWA) domain